ncbi:MAG: hypothetical protein CM15mP49_37200 [Actinomycetota bacterium]|nr:MAG: hypothetical protein CM15mP49_37200 [Actinomycetota bacterium]
MLQHKFLQTRSRSISVRQQVIQLLSGYSGSGEQEGEGGRKGERASAGTGGRGGDSEFLNGSRSIWQKPNPARKEGKVDPVIGRSREAERCHAGS